VVSFWIRFLLCVVVGLIAAHPLRAASFAGTLVLGRPTDVSVVANVVSPTTASAYIEFGITSGNYPARTAEITLNANEPREIELKGAPLLANTRGYYRLRFRAPGAATFDATPEYSFMTQRAPGSTFVFAVQGDSHPERAKQMFDSAFYTRTLQTIAADNPDFFLTLGDDFSVDTINQANPAAVTQPQVVERYTIQRPYLDQLGRTAAVFLVNGNHEQAARYILDGTPNNVAVWAQNARNLYYAQPAPDTFYTGNSEVIPNIGLLRNYYAWTWGDALFVTIDPYWGSPVCVDNDFYGGTKRSDMWTVTHGDAQYLWLKATLEQSKAKYKFVFAHHVMGTQRGGVDVATLYEWGGMNPNGTPGFAQRRPTWAMPIHQLMAANKVTIFFQGHDHIFVHQQLDGVTYQSLGNPADPNYSLFNSDAYATGERFPNSGYARVTVGPSGVKVDYVRTYLPADETPTKKNGSVEFTYTTAASSALKPTPEITVQPAAVTVAAGMPATFTVIAQSSLPMTYQWRRNGVNLPGATLSGLTLANVQATEVGGYSVVVTTTSGSVTSASAPLALGTSRLVNLSVRSSASAADPLIAGFVVGAGEALPLLVRGVGPTLGAFGVPGVLTDPTVTVVASGGATVASNDNWGTASNAAQLSASALQLGAFALPNASLDAALLPSLPSGAYTALVAGKGAAAGIALAEAYDAAADATKSARLINVSARTRVGTGADILIAGFVIQGTAPKQVLIRAVGPTLAAFGVSGTLADPQLALFRQGSTTPLQQNDNWLQAANAAQIGLASAQVGAFSLAANSKDAAILVTLEPGAYTAQVSGVGATTGTALVEIYEVL
jgi:hypothetical protein